jgi:hypothetical protein
MVDNVEQIIQDEYSSPTPVYVRVRNVSAETVQVYLALMSEFEQVSSPDSAPSMARAPEPTGGIVNSLAPNYPNPFNPETWIPFSLSEEADVTVHIYDARGSLVRTLAPGRLAEGVYYTRDKALHWDGRNALGESVPSGVYFYYLRAGEYAATRKLLVSM